MSGDSKNMTALERIIKKMITIKTFVILSITYFVIGTLEDYFFWIAQQELPSYVFGILASITMLILTFLAIALFFRTIINKELRWVKKIGRILLIICIFLFLIYVPTMISDYLGEGKVVSKVSTYSVLHFTEYT